ncbi:MAG: hypothetical protein LBR33_07590 [Propionibacteriaceae bacterium]|jgi:hypothetical protein|nr:hypothetical protein [Propionibacteriaceae bacterium]
MPRRVDLPGASELFRSTGTPPKPVTRVTASTAKATAGAAGAAGRRRAEPPLEASGRVRHDEKITVYVSAEELIALEQARLRLRQEGIAVDRGRMVRGAIASALDDLRARGLKADIVQRLGD